MSAATPTSPTSARRASTTPTLAEIVGHRIETMLARYTHSVGVSFGAVKAAIG